MRCKDCVFLILDRDKSGGRTGYRVCYNVSTSPGSHTFQPPNAPVCSHFLNYHEIIKEDKID